MSQGKLRWAAWPSNSFLALPKRSEPFRRIIDFMTVLDEEVVSADLAKLCSCVLYAGGVDQR